MKIIRQILTEDMAVGRRTQILAAPRAGSLRHVKRIRKADNVISVMAGNSFRAGFVLDDDIGRYDVAGVWSKIAAKAPEPRGTRSSSPASPRNHV